jgi:hypothetical protein
MPWQAKYDAHGDGYVDVNDLRKMIIKLGLPADEVGKMLDVDADADVARVDSCSSMQTQAPLRRRLSRLSSRRMRSSKAVEGLLAERVMTKYDASGDHQLDMREFKELLTTVVACLLRIQPLDRNQGAWALPSADSVEPARTERLLAQPFAIRRYRATDIVDQLGFHLWVRTHGRSRLGVLWCWASMMLQALLAVILGIGPYLSDSPTAARVQVRWQQSSSCGCLC